ELSHVRVQTRDHASGDWYDLAGGDSGRPFVEVRATGNTAFPVVRPGHTANVLAPFPAVYNLRIQARAQQGTATVDVYGFAESDLDALRAFFSATEIAEVRMDPSTHGLLVLLSGHHHIHNGEMFSVHMVEVDFDNSSEIGILFTTPNTTTRGHLLVLVDCGTAAWFEILQTPTLDVGNYPSTFYNPFNRDLNNATESVMSSVRAAPNAGEVSLKLKADTTPISADGTAVHVEIVGTGKKGGGVGNRDTDERLLKQNTTYYFRLKGLGTGVDNSVATLSLIWYEHADLD
ncbi:hypothetical protein LCGC14_1766060, partial [marine sediment metagenome]